ncbi:isochorismatase hydrolase [Burkholderia sp. BT03]|nr:isochorismatase hydrolase [Burkholderia sp. BT03]
MPNTVYRAERTGLLLVDPYNDFLSEGGKLFPMIKEIATNVRLLDNLRATVAAARKADIQVFYVPHRRWQPGDYDNWDHPCLLYTSRCV